MSGTVALAVNDDKVYPFDPKSGKVNDEMQFGSPSKKDEMNVGSPLKLPESRPTAEISQVFDDGDCWIPPSTDVAEKHRDANIVGTHSKLVDCKELGVGVCMYFQFLKSMGYYMLIASLLSVPSILTSIYGSRVPIQDRDALGLYKFTLGNIGYDTASPTYT